VERRSDKYFGAGTALRQISLAAGGTLTLMRSGKSRRSLLVRLTLEQFIFWPKLPQTRDLASKISKIFPGGTPRTPSARGGDPVPHPPAARLHAVRGGASSPVAGAQAPPLLGRRSRKPFPQIKIYHYIPGVITPK